MVCEKEMVREEVIEEVIEYEYEVVGDQRRCVGQKNLGRTVTVQVRKLSYVCKIIFVFLCIVSSTLKK